MTIESGSAKSAFSGAPAWVTLDLLADTRETWQAYYTDELTDLDSLEILLGVSRLIDALHNQTIVLETEA